MKRRKNIFKSMLALVLVLSMLTATAVFTACGPEQNDPEPVKVTGVALNKTSLSLQVGKDETLIATVSPVDADDKSVTWSSSNAEIASVDQSGKVTAISDGNATVTVTTTDGSKKANCVVTVTPIPVPATGVSIAEDVRSMMVGNTRKLTVSFEPANVTDKTVTWTSSNSTVAAVAEDGTITAAAVGSATITVKTATDKTATAVINVVESITGDTAISTPEDFLALNGLFDAAKSFSSNGEEGTISGNFYLKNDIDFEGAVIKPIGGNEFGTNVGNPTGRRYYAFNGTFDGRGYAIKNFETGMGGPVIVESGSMQSSAPTEYSSSLFAGTSSSAVIRNLSVINGTINPSGARRSGVLVGTLRGTIENCYINGKTNTAGSNNYEIGGAMVGTFLLGARANNIVVDVAGNANIYPIGRIESTTANSITNCFITLDGLEFANKSTVWCFENTNASAVASSCVRFNKADIATVDFSVLPSDSWTLNAGALPILSKYTVPATAIGTVAEFTTALNPSTRTGHYYLTNDIDFTGTPIQSIAGNGAANVFNGTFDGRGYALKNIQITSAGETPTGDEEYNGALFAGIGSYAVIRNVAVIGKTTAYATNRSGILIGTPRGGLVENCYIEGTIEQKLNNDYARSGAIFGGTDGDPKQNDGSGVGGPIIFRNIVSKVKATGANADRVYVVGRTVANYVNNSTPAELANNKSLSVDNCFVVTDELTQTAVTDVSAASSAMTNIKTFKIADIGGIDFSSLPSSFWKLNAGGLPSLINSLPTSISLNKTSTSIDVTQTETLTLIGASTASWVSSNPSVARVDQNGKITAIAAGTTTISAVAGPNMVARCMVTVNFNQAVALNNMKHYNTTASTVVDGQLADQGFFTPSTWLGFASNGSGGDASGSVYPEKVTDGGADAMKITSATDKGRINALSVIRPGTENNASPLIYNIGDQKMLGKCDGIVYNYTIMVKATGAFAISTFNTGGFSKDFQYGTGLNYKYGDGKFSITHSLNRMLNVVQNGENNTAATAETNVIATAADTSTGFSLNAWHRLDFTYVVYTNRIYSAFYIDGARVSFTAGNTASTTACENGNINFMRQVSGTHGPRVSFIVPNAGDELLLKYAV